MTKIKEVEDILEEYMSLISYHKMLQITFTDRPDCKGFNYTGLPGDGQPKAISENVSIQRVDQEKQMKIAKKKVEVIQAGLDALTPLQRKIIELKYFMILSQGRENS